MEHTKSNFERYTQYVSECIASGNMPMDFQTWKQDTIRKSREARPFSLMRFSTVMNATITIKVNACDISEATKKVDAQLSRMEQDYVLQNGSNGKVLSPAEQKAKLEKQVQSKLNAIARKQAAIEKEEQKINELVAKRLQQFSQLN